MSEPQGHSLAAGTADGGIFGGADGGRAGAEQTAEACPSCLRRAWLLAALAPYLEKTQGRRVAELLARDDAALLAAVAPRHAGRIAADLAAVPVGSMRRAVAEAGCWSTCRHRDDYPPGLRELGDCPAALFGRGDRGRLAALTPQRSVTVVGSRRATAYGLAVARDLGYELAMAGMSVVSGMALGIDARAHSGALEAGLSCAVLGCGADVVYPPRNRSVYMRHLERGLILSELPVGTAAWRWMFPARNRLMAAISGMTIVVEARQRSGSLITAGLAQELGRDLGAVPGPVTSAVSRGSNELVAQGACLVRDAQDVLDAMLGAGQVRVPIGPPLDSELASALEAFEIADGDLDAFAAGLEGGAAAASVALARLELLGYLRASGPGDWVRTSLAAPDGAAAAGAGSAEARGDRL